MWDWCAFCIVQECETLNPKPQPSFCAIWTIFSLICAGSEGDSALGLGFIIIPWNARQCPEKKGDVIQGARHLLRHHRQFPGKNMSKTGILVVHLILILLSATSAWTISLHPYVSVKMGIQHVQDVASSSRHSGSAPQANWWLELSATCSLRSWLKLSMWIQVLQMPS